MTEIENNNEEYIAVSLEYGPGQMLADNRESKGLSINDVAAQLNITEDIINGLERDDYSNLPPAIYTRGYLRSYANLLGIDPEPLLERQMKLTSTRDEVVKAPTKIQPANSRTIIKKKKYKRRKDSSSTLFIIFLVIVLVAICYGIWAFLTRETAIYPASNGAEITIEQTKDSVQGGGAGIEEESLDAISDKESNISLPVEDKSVNSLPVDQRSGFESEVLSSTEKTQTMSLSLPNSNNSTNEDNENAVEQSESLDNSSIEEQMPEEKIQKLANQQIGDANKSLSETLVNTFEKDNVRLTLSADSYVEIKDATGKKFFFTVIPGSSVKTIQGKRPFNVKLGNAGAVKVEFNGQNYDFGNFDLGEVAKFQLK